MFLYSIDERIENQVKKTSCCLFWILYRLTRRLTTKWPLNHRSNFKRKPKGLSRCKMKKKNIAHEAIQVHIELNCHFAMGTSEMECSSKLSHIGNIRHILSSSSSATDAQPSCFHSKNNGSFLPYMNSSVWLSRWVCIYDCYDSLVRFWKQMPLNVYIGRTSADNRFDSFLSANKTKGNPNACYIFAAVSFCDVLLQ